MTGLLVVYYGYPPDANYDHVVSQKAAHAGTELVFIIDITSLGAGSAPSAAFLKVTQQLQAVGVKVIGYVWTNYGSRVGPQAQLDVSNYALWYKTDGIFLDGVDANAGTEGGYAALATLARSLGEALVIGNPGTALQGSAYAPGTFDALITWETTGYPADLSQSYIADGVPFDAAKVAASTGRYIFATDTSYTGGLPTYFDQLVAALDTGVAPPPPTDAGDVIRKTPFRATITFD